MTATTADNTARYTQAKSAFGFELSKLVGLDEDLYGIASHTDIYPLVDPAPHFRAHTFAAKVVLVTGASRGIGATIAQHFARAGASLALVARSEALLNYVKAGIEQDVPGAQVLTFVLDVRDTAAVCAAVAETVRHFGRLDVLVANAGALVPLGKRFGAVDPNAWWDTVATNLRGVFNFFHFAAEHLQQSAGSAIAITSAAGHLRIPTGSDYSVSKHALDRLVEFFPIEYPAVKAFAMHPGGVSTELSRGSNAPIHFDTTPALGAAVALHLAAGKAEWLSGRYLSAQWDLGEVEAKHKTAIVDKNMLVQKLALP
ncbi:NAD-P-binding protein [Artomyces pyxidatus]|uniref:NAD-P-binding protein n=1 Tax=Artomyces pyxidatus TaxID=48021 RepID=A0ACB8TDL7_9AGAM|nr:NAD-P-binding protein [Artomyces pyxidatus]